MKQCLIIIRINVQNNSKDIGGVFKIPIFKTLLIYFTFPLCSLFPFASYVYSYSQFHSLNKRIKRREALG